MKDRRSRDRIKLRRASPVVARYEIEGRCGEGRVTRMARDGVFVACDDPPDVLAAGRAFLSDDSGNKAEVEGVVRRSDRSSSSHGFYLQIEMKSDDYADLYERVFVL